MRTPLGERDYCFFVVRRVSRELTPGHLGDGRRGSSAIALCKCVVRSMTRSTSIRGRIPLRRRLPVRNFVDVVLRLKTAAQSGMPRALDLLFVGVNQGDLAIVGT
jgi:hypothetical protein